MYQAIKYGTNYIWSNQLLRLSMRMGRCLTKPCQVYIIWTGLCNFRCPMCKIQEWKEKLSIDVIKDLIDQLSRWGVPRFVIAGGEPLLFKEEFLTILEYANRKGLFTHFSTNGTNLERQFLRDYAAMGGGQVTISLDGATKETHDRSRNYDGAYEIAMDAIEAYRSERPRNVILKIQPVLTNDNIDEVVGIFEIARESHALYSVQAFDTMDFDILRRDVTLAEVREKYPLWISEENFPRMEEAIGSLLNLRKKYPGIILNTPEHLEYMIRYFKRTLDFVGKCLVGYTSLFISPDGQITMCLYGNIGNVKDSSLKELWYSEKFDRVRKQMLACDRPCLNGCAQRHSTGKILVEGFNYLKRRLTV